MSIADAPARNGAKIAIRKAGRPITYVRTGDPVGNVATGRVTSSETEYSLYGVLTRVSWNLVDGTKIQHTDQMVLIDAATFEAEVGSGEIPKAADRIKIGTADYAVVAIFPVSSGEEWALFKVVVRR